MWTLDNSFACNLKSSSYLPLTARLIPCRQDPTIRFIILLKFLWFCHGCFWHACCDDIYVVLSFLCSSNYQTAIKTTSTKGLIPSPSLHRGAREALNVHLCYTLLQEEHVNIIETYIKTGWGLKWWFESASSHLHDVWLISDRMSVILCCFSTSAAKNSTLSWCVTVNEAIGISVFPCRNWLHLTLSEWVSELRFHAALMSLHFMWIAAC